MTGIVFTQLLEWIENQYSYTVVDHLLLSCDLPSDGVYTTGGSYEHRELWQLVNQFAAMVDLNQADILRAFGHHMFGYFIQTKTFQMKHSDSTFSLLHSLSNIIHDHVHKLHPEAELPKFVAQQLSPNHLQVIYQSERQLGDFAHGLIEASLAHFNEPASIHRTNLTDNGNRVLFDIFKAVESGNLKLNATS